MEQIAEFDPEVAYVQQQDHRLDLGVVVRILDGEHAQGLAIDRANARRRVAHALTYNLARVVRAAFSDDGAS